jgi:pimeloyl-ACP methyl ester carboxylesterase
VTEDMERVGESVRGESTVHYRTARVNELDVFREAGPRNAPTLLLLHGFPTSSSMFRNLIPRLADAFHVVAPGYPSVGQSSMPDHEVASRPLEVHAMKLVLDDGTVFHGQSFGAPI